jgi:hypothetical protein
MRLYRFYSTLRASLLIAVYAGGCAHAQEGTCDRPHALIYGRPMVADNSTVTDPSGLSLIQAFYPMPAIGTGSIWFSFEAQGESCYITSGVDGEPGSARDTVMALYSRSDCGSLQEIVSNDDDRITGDGFASLSVADVRPGTGYLVRVTSHHSDVRGRFIVGVYNEVPTGACYVPNGSCEMVTFRACFTRFGIYAGDGVTCAAGICASRPDNDTCTAAIPIVVLPANITADSSCATSDIARVPELCEIPETEGTLWYSIVGTGGQITATTCYGDVESVIAVFCDSCGRISCLGYSDKDGSCSRGATYSWCSSVGKTYYIVTGALAATPPGEFTLRVSDGGPCTDPYGCCPGDMDGDGVTTAADFTKYLAFYSSQNVRADANHDGQLNTADFGAFLQLYALGCP